MNGKTIYNFAEWLNRIVALKKRQDGKFIRRQELRLRKRLALLWKKQMNWIIENMDDELPQFNTNAATPDDFLEGMPKQKEIAETIVATMRVSLAKGAKTIIKKLELGEFGITFNLENEAAREFLGGKLSHELSNYKGNIHRTTTNRISKILRDAGKSGASYTETSKLIQAQQKNGVFSQARGELISTREVGIAYEKGNDIPIQEFITENPDRRVLKLWRTVGDDRVTAQCSENGSKGWIDYALKFPSGDDSAPRDDHPRCRCFTERKIDLPKK